MSGDLIRTQFLCNVGGAAATNRVPWFVVSTEEIADIRASFLRLPRPLFNRYTTRTVRPGMGLPGIPIPGKFIITELELTTNTEAFVRGQHTEVALAAALFPLLADQTYSGDAAIVLLDVSPNWMIVEDMKSCGYRSPDNSGSWFQKGARARQDLREDLRCHLWLDQRGMPVLLPGGFRPRFGYWFVTRSSCSDEASTR